MSKLFLKLASRFHVFLYKASSGRFGGRFGKAPVLLLSTTGRKSGKRRTTPLLYREDGDRYVVVASAGGAPAHPAWYLNLRGNPAAAIQVGNRHLAVKAETAGAEDHARLWPVMTSMYRQYDDYQAKTNRTIPIVLLRPEVAETNDQR